MNELLGKIQKEREILANICSRPSDDTSSLIKAMIRSNLLIAEMLAHQTELTGEVLAHQGLLDPSLDEV